MTVLAYALGEESFLDANGNNVYDQGEDYQDLGDIFIDRLFNGTYNAQEDQFISLSNAGASSCRVADSVLLRLGVDEPSRTITNTGVPLATCNIGWGRAYVRRAAQTILSSSQPRPMYGTSLPPGARALGGSCPSPLSLLKEIDDSNHGYTSNDAEIRRSYYEFGSVAISNLPKVGVIFFLAADANQVAFNPMPARTVISVTATKGLSATVNGGSPIPSTLSPTGVAIGYGFDDTTTSGTVTVTFTTPKGLATAVSQFITMEDKGGISCP